MKKIMIVEDSSLMIAVISNFIKKEGKDVSILEAHSGDEAVEMRHWIKARSITEAWRRDLHHLYHQLGGNKRTRPLSDDEKVIRQIRIRFPTSREIQQYTNLLSDRVEEILERLIREEMIIPVRDGKTTRYRLADQMPEEVVCRTVEL